MTGRALFQPTSLSAIALAVPCSLSRACPRTGGGRAGGPAHVGGPRLAGPDLVRPRRDVGIITPFMFLYALHDALVKPMPGNPQAPSLAESWTSRPTGSRTSSSCARACGFTTAIR